LRKLSEIKGEDAIDILADLIEPISEFSQDKTFIGLIRSGERIEAVRHALKTHKKAVIRAMAILEGENPDSYAPPLLRLPAMLLEVFNDPELIALFQSEQTVTSSGSATENTEATAEE
jgi:hypothetical protein